MNITRFQLSKHVHILRSYGCVKRYASWYRNRNGAASIGQTIDKIIMWKGSSKFAGYIIVLVANFTGCIIIIVYIELKYLFSCCGIYFLFHHRFFLCFVMVVFVYFYWTAIISSSFFLKTEFLVTNMYPISIRPVLFWVYSAV